VLEHVNPSGHAISDKLPAGQKAPDVQLVFVNELLQMEPASHKVQVVAP